VLFDDRAWGWKFAFALALIAGLGVLSAVRGDAFRPSLVRCLARPELHDGATIWIPAAPVLRTGTDGFVVRFEGLDVAVRGRADVSPGGVVGVRGRFRASDGGIDLDAWRRVGPLGGTRRLVEFVSLLVLAAVAWNFLRHFAVRRKALELELRG
jgi:hypothetical protein